MDSLHNKAIDLFSHSKWDKAVLENIFSSALKFNSLAEFHLEEPAKYRIAKNRNVLSYIASQVKDGFKPIRACYVYYIKITYEDDFSDKPAEVFKIGLTQHSNIAQRFKTELPDGTKIKVLNKFKFSTITEAYDYEQNIIRMNTEHLYHGPQLLVHTKNTEIFKTDIREHG